MEANKVCNYFLGPCSAHYHVIISYEIFQGSFSTLEINKKRWVVLKNGSKGNLQQLQLLVMTPKLSKEHLYQNL